tara:strand:+ start:237 stop:587 length:351 start_codon:yes stop_codon:yes gene_type:complete
MPQSFDGNGAGGGGSIPRQQLFPRSPYSISFVLEFVYFSETTMGSGNITVDQTDAVLGVVQKLYHTGGLLDPIPTITGVSDVQKIGTGTYVLGSLNIIYLEWTETDRVEYWITQEG